MRRSLVVGNWKMNGGRDWSRSFASELLAGLGEGCKGEVGVCPPFLHIPAVGEILAGSPIILGSQNVADQDEGAFTGEISASMLKEFGCRLAIVGHSERRALYGESDALVAARYARAIENGLIPILCIGETLEERESDQTFSVLSKQLYTVLDLSDVGSLSSAVIAYEPVWAIGTGRTASPEQAQEVHAWIRARVAEMDAAVAENLQILYGGSVKPDNAQALFSMADIDGGLIGGASLNAQSFLAICHSA